MFEHFVSNYGYIAILIGTFLEGETIMVIGGIAAHAGYLSIDGVIISGWLGTLAGDQLYFYLGRRHGDQFLKKRPAWSNKINKILRLIERNQNLLIIFFRFLYGLRTVAPFTIGLSNVTYIRYSILNCIGGAIWAIAIGFAGYFFGQAVEIVIGEIKQYEAILIYSVIGVSILIWTIYLIKKRKDNETTGGDIN